MQVPERRIKACKPCRVSLCFAGFPEHVTKGWPEFQDQRHAQDEALVAQLDRALDYESRGREFESSRARHFLCFT